MCIRDSTPIRTEAGVSFYQIRPHIIACCCGVSKVNAAMGAQLLISLYHPDLVLNAGVAGCFENVPIGTIVLAEGFVQHDVDTTAIGDPVGLVSTVNQIRFPTADPPAAKAALDATASFVSSSSLAVIITSRLYRQKVYTKREAVAVATCFSAVSIGFAYLVISTAGVAQHLSLIHILFRRHAERSAPSGRQAFGGRGSGNALERPDHRGPSGRRTLR